MWNFWRTFLGIGFGRNVLGYRFYCLFKNYVLEWNNLASLSSSSCSLSFFYYFFSLLWLVIDFFIFLSLFSFFSIINWRPPPFSWERHILSIVKWDIFCRRSTSSIWERKDKFWEINKLLMKKINKFYHFCQSPFFLFGIYRGK